MKNPYAYLETAALVVMELAISAAAALSLHLDLLNLIYPSYVWGERNGILLCLMAICSSGIAIAAAGSFIMIRYHRRTLSAYCFDCVRSVLLEVSATCKWFLTAGQMRHDASWLALIILIGAAVRSFFLAQPMRYDEAYTFLKFVNHGLFFHFVYLEPNNHVLHTLLVRMSVEFFGSHPVAIRLPAVLAGLLAIPLTFHLSRSLSGNRKSGFFAATLIAVFPYLILYDTMARGYSLVVLLSLCLVALGARVIEHPSMRLCPLMAFVTALGVLNMPSFLFPAAGVFCWISLMLVQRRRKPIWVLVHVLTPYALIAAALIGLFYTPVAMVSNGIDGIINNRYITSLSWQEFLTRLPAHISSTANDFVRDIPFPLLIVSLVLLVVGFYATAREQRWSIFMLLPAVVIGSAVLFFVKHAIPYARTWIFLLPFIFILLDAGLAAFAKCSDVYLKIVSLLLAGCAAVLIMNRDMISSYPDTGHFPEAPVVVDTLADEMTSADRIVVQCPASAPTSFYMWYRGVPRKRSRSDGRVPLREFIVVKPSCYSLADVTKRQTRRLLKLGDAELYVAEMNQDMKTFQQMKLLDKK